VLGARMGFGVDDVVIAEVSDSHVVHRVVEVLGDTVVTMGDANQEPDEPVSRGSVKCVVVWVLDPPYSYYALSALYVLLIYASCIAIHTAHSWFKYRRGTSK